MSNPNETSHRAWRRGTNYAAEMSKFALVLGDTLALTLSGLLAFVFSFYADPRNPANFASWLAPQSTARYLTWMLIAGLGLLLFFDRFKHYRERKPFWTELGEILHNVFWLAVLDMFIVALARWNSSRMWWFSAWFIAAALIPIFRSLVRRLLTRLGTWQRPTVLIGSGPNAQEAVMALRSESQLGFNVLGCVEISPQEHIHDHTTTLPPRIEAEKIRELAKFGDLQVIIAVEHDQSIQRERWLRQLMLWKVQDVCVIPALRGIPLYGTDISWFFSHEVALLRLRNNLKRWPARLTKRVFDVVVSLLLLILLAPIMIWLALRVRSDGGPALFAHHRVGREGKTFPCFKFRSMVIDAPKRLEKLLESDPNLRAEWERDHKLKDDPRISTVGHFLRRTSLDELPQLLNVLRGEMSLVGPRPIVTAELEKYGEDAEYFLMVRPGITGLWQVSGRNDVDYDTRVYLDTWYVKNWSLWYDIAILFKTVRVVLRRDGAY